MEENIIADALDAINTGETRSRATFLCQAFEKSRKHVTHGCTTVIVVGRVTGKIIIQDISAVVVTAILVCLPSRLRLGSFSLLQQSVHVDVLSIVIGEGREAELAAMGSPAAITTTTFIRKQPIGSSRKCRSANISRVVQGIAHNARVRQGGAGEKCTGGGAKTTVRCFFSLMLLVLPVGVAIRRRKKKKSLSIVQSSEMLWIGLGCE